MKSHIFVVFILLLTVGFMQAFSVFQFHFSGLNELKREKKILISQIEQKELQYQLAEYKLNELQTEIALAMSQISGKKLKGERAYPLRQLASVTQTPLGGKNLKLLAKNHFQKGKAFFKKRQYDQANKEFLKIINDFSYSIHVVEAYFLLIEGYYQLNQNELALKYIDQLVSQYPENDLTGYAMLRLGKIFESQDRQEEASGIYKTIMQTFNDHDLVIQAKTALRSIQL